MFQHSNDLAIHERIVALECIGLLSLLQWIQYKSRECSTVDVLDDSFRKFARP